MAQISVGSNQVYNISQSYSASDPLSLTLGENSTTIISGYSVNVSQITTPTSGTNPTILVTNNGSLSIDEGLISSGTLNGLNININGNSTVTYQGAGISQPFTDEHINIDFSGPGGGTFQYNHGTLSTGRTFDISNMGSGDKLILFDAAHDRYVTPPPFLPALVSPSATWVAPSAGETDWTIQISMPSLTPEQLITYNIKVSSKVHSLLQSTNLNNLINIDDNGIVGDVITFALPTRLPDYIVDGTSGNDSISLGYVDADGDAIDSNDNQYGNNDDVVVGYGGNDTIDAGSGNDLVFGDDTLNSIVGNDLLYGNVGNDTLYGGRGLDVLYGGIGNDSLYGGFDNDTLLGGDGDDVIYGGDGNNSLYGGGGDNTIFGGNGDELIYGGDGFAIINPASGSDTIYGGQGGGIVDASGYYNDKVIYGGSGSSTLIGGHGNDLIYGGSGNDSIVGNAGNDTLRGQQGNDSIYGGSDDDELWTGSGTDLVYGGTGNDNILVGWTDNTNVIATVYGDGGNDRIEVLSNNATLVGYGGDGDDTLLGGTAANDQLYGGSGNDSQIAEGGNDQMWGGIGNDSLYGGAGNDTLLGGDDDDFVSGGADRDSLEGGSGRDILWGGDGSDTLYGGDGDDSILDGDGDDLLYGGAGNDTLKGGIGNDTIEGGVGNDLIEGGADDDIVDGDEGNDTLAGDAGNDTLTGGLGDDIFKWNFGGSPITAPPTSSLTSEFGDDVILDFRHGNTGSVDDGDITNNDYVDLSWLFNSYTLENYNNANGTNIKNPLEALRHDLTDGVISFNGFDMNGPNLTINFDDPSLGPITTDETSVVCFGGDSLIETAQGWCKASDLEVGTYVKTKDNGMKPILWVGKRHLSAELLQRHPNMKPVRVKANTFGFNMPSCDLVVSPQHRLLVNFEESMRNFGAKEVLVAAKHMQFIHGVETAVDLNEVTYVHFLCDAHEIVFANGLPCESLYLGSESLKAMSPSAIEEIKFLFPQLDDAFPPCRSVINGGVIRRLNKVKTMKIVRSNVKQKKVS